MRLAKMTFRIAGIYGATFLAPQYFLEKRIALDFPPAITHPEHFYGFIGVALAWQVAFFVIASDPVRYRPLMGVAVLEKVSFGSAAIVLYVQQRLAALTLAAGIVDLILAGLFILAMQKTPKIDFQSPS